MFIQRRLFVETVMTDALFFGLWQEGEGGSKRGRERYRGREEERDGEVGKREKGREGERGGERAGGGEERVGEWG